MQKSRKGRRVFTPSLPDHLCALLFFQAALAPEVWLIPLSKTAHPISLRRKPIMWARPTFTIIWSILLTSVHQALATKASVGVEADGSVAAFEDEHPVLSRLLSPSPGLEAFVKDYWHRKPCLIKRKNTTFYRNNTRGWQVWSVLREGVNVQADEDYKLIKRAKGPDGEWWSTSPDLTTYRRGHDHIAAKEAFMHGFTVVVNSMDHRLGAVREVAEAFEGSMGHRCSVNLYYSPPGSQGFQAHMDWMDAFVMQLEGTKRWKVYSSLLDFPRQDMVFYPTTKQIGRPSMEVTLQAGDLLYLPAGVVHEATTQGTFGSSLHVTAGVECGELGSWESVLLDVVAKATDGEAYAAGLRCAEGGRSLGEILARRVEERRTVRWGDVLSAVVVEAARGSTAMRDDVRLTRVMRGGEGWAAEVGRLAAVVKELGGVGVAAWGRVQTEPAGKKGALGRRGFGPAGQRVMARLKEGYKGGAATAPKPDQAGLKEALGALVCVLGEEGNASRVLEGFARDMRAEMERRRGERAENLRRVGIERPSMLTERGPAA